LKPSAGKVYSFEVELVEVVDFGGSGKIFRTKNVK
jgi:hypothetical protein